MNKQVRFIARNSWLWNRCAEHENTRVETRREKKKVRKQNERMKEKGNGRGRKEKEGRIRREESITVCRLVLIIEVTGATLRGFIRFELRHALSLTIALRTLVSTWCLQQQRLFRLIVARLKKNSNVSWLLTRSAAHLPSGQFHLRICTLVLIQCFTVLAFKWFDIVSGIKYLLILNVFKICH